MSGDRPARDSGDYARSYAGVETLAERDSGELFTVVAEGTASADGIELHPVETPGATCSCGADVGDVSRGTGADFRELWHYVWAIRRSGERSNLGYCPERRGLETAKAEARNAFGPGGRALYHGEIY